VKHSPSQFSVYEKFDGTAVLIEGSDGVLTPGGNAFEQPGAPGFLRISTTASAEPGWWRFSQGLCIQASPDRRLVPLALACDGDCRE
jgi:hypothetical protein